MLTVPALKVQQFKQEFYLLNLAAADVERLVRFEVLGEAGLDGGRHARRRGTASPVNWVEIEKKVHTSEKAFQRPILRKKIEDLAEHYRQCRDDGAVPAIPGAVLLTSDQPVEFTPHGSNPFVGLVQMSEGDGTLRVLDGQHRLLSLAALLASADSDAVRGLQVPAILFAGLPPPSVVEMFVTINSKHTRLDPSLLYTLKGRQLYPDPLDSAIHDAIKALNGSDGSPLCGQVKMLGVGPGKVPQAGLAQEMRAAIEAVRGHQPEAQWLADLLAHVGRFYALYFREVARVFADVWESRKHSIRGTIALRAFVQASPPVIARVFEVGGDPRATMRALLAPWSTRIGPDRFETAAAWRAKAAGGGKETTRVLARELVAALAEVGG
ncbi:MAG: DGQHR domain-containing protein [Deltaproteobacteria bacterium]|nr:DGQHR domain-containing protein [Deltaproteobacteria bacterium]